jgi:N-acetylmuramoyl-L-alanine amidase
MAKKICIQAGHEGRTTGSTGAPNEQSFNVDVSNQVAEALKLRGFEVKRVNADPTDEEIAGDWDLFLAIHYDADTYKAGGGFVDYPEPSTDGATLESQRIAYLLRQEYFGTTGIVSHPERSNKNTRYYYMWSKLSAKTPCVLIECGVGMHIPDDWQILHHDRSKVVEGIVKGICMAFNLPYDITSTNPSDTPQNPSDTPTQPTTNPTPSEPSEAEKTLLSAKEIVWGKGWPWQKVNKLKVLLPK